MRGLITSLEFECENEYDCILNNFVLIHDMLYKFMYVS